MNEGYSAAELITIIAALGVFVTGVGAVIVNIVVALRSSHKLGAVIEKTDKLSGQVEQVHTLTNSNLSAVKAELSSAVRELASMKELVTDLKAERDKAATTQALPAKHESAASGVATGIAREQLEVQKKIEENTAPAKS